MLYAHVLSASDMLCWIATDKEMLQEPSCMLSSMPKAHLIGATTNLWDLDLHFFKYALDLPICLFCLTIGLWMISCGNLMGDSIPVHKSLKRMVTKMWPLVTNYNTWSSVPRQNMIFKKFDDNCIIISTARYSFNPFRNIINGKQNLNIPKRRWEWSQKIDPPTIKNFYH